MQKFNEFVLILHNELRLDTLAQQLVDKLSKNAGQWPRQPMFSGQNMNAGQPDNYIM